MEQSNGNNKNPNQSNEKIRAKYHFGNSSFYLYKDPSGKTIQITRPAFVKVKDLE